jgi:DNA-binding response OmpR family regulator
MMDTKAKILVVDDEASIRYFLEETLVDAGYQVVAVESGEAALERIAVQIFDLALVDLRLPGIGGIEVLTALRRQSPDTTVIVLTAHASVETAVEALRQGAHDYLFKPCEPAQLRDSVRAGLTKRQRELRHREVLSQLEHTLSHNLEEILTTAFERAIVPPTEPPEDQVRLLQRGGLIVNLVRRAVTLDGRLLELSPTEFDLLAYLAGEAPRIVSPRELAREALKYDGEPWEVADMVRSHIYRIRQKVKAVAADTDVIRTARGVGYTISDEYM